MIERGDNWRPLGLAAMKVLFAVERQRQSERIFGSVPTDDELRKIYPQKDKTGGAGDAAA